MYKNLTSKELECLYTRFSQKPFDKSINIKYRKIITEEVFEIINEMRKRRREESNL